MIRPQKQRMANAHAFTLIELLLVITIISVLAAVVVPSFFGRSKEARVVSAKQTIVGTLGTGLSVFEQDTGRFPTTDEGLEALINDPQIPNWRGSYIQSVMVPLDPWGNEYTYAYPSQIHASANLYDIVSAGPDGVFGNEDDVTNHNLQVYGSRNSSG